ncbi:MAG: hypothetical protein FJ091_19295 [Deltaproteobacteria bacterium]|nr:hypothetical protein [Deltaproteobacteria bacterium]
MTLSTTSVPSGIFSWATIVALAATPAGIGSSVPLGASSYSSIAEPVQLPPSAIARS